MVCMSRYSYKTKTGTCMKAIFVDLPTVVTIQMI